MHCPKALVWAGVALAACTGPDPREDAVLLQASAASSIVSQILSNPGPIRTVCVGAADSGGPALQGSDLRLAVRPDGVKVLPEDRCEVAPDGVLRGPERAQAVSVAVAPPEADVGGRATVQIITSTGSRDLAAYSCRLRRVQGEWTVDRCDLEAIS